MKKKTLGSLLLGASIGAGLGLLFAPRKGSETRKMVSEKLNELCMKVREIDPAEVRDDIEKRISSIKKELKELDKEKALDVVKKKSALLKGKIDDLLVYAKDKATPVVVSAVEELRKSAIKATKEITKKLEEKEPRK